MTPAQGLGIGQIAAGSRNASCLDQCAELEVDGVHIGGPAGEVAESAVRVAAAQRPVGTAGDRLLHPGLIAAELAEDEDGVEAGVDIPVGLLDVPAAIRLLVAEHPGDHGFGLRSGLAQQPEKVGHVKGRGDVIAQVAVAGLALHPCAARACRARLRETACPEPHTAEERSWSCTREACL